jgi:hypothetical protein
VASSQKHRRISLTQTNLVGLPAGFWACQNSKASYLSCRSWKTVNSLCPACGCHEIGKVVFYFQCCELMSRTVPFFYVGCASCVDQKTARILWDNICYTATLEGTLALQNVLDTLD